MESREFLDKVERVWRAAQAPLEIERDVVKGNARAELFARRNGRSALIVRFSDFFWYHDFDNIDTDDPLALLQQQHEAARTHANTLYALPKSLRLSLPIIVSVAVSSRGFSEEMIRAVMRSTYSPIGGEGHQLFLIDLARNHVFGQGQRIMRAHWHGGGVGGSFNLQFQHTDWINRTRAFVVDSANDVGSLTAN